MVEEPGDKNVCWDEGAEMERVGRKMDTTTDIQVEKNMRNNKTDSKEPTEGEDSVTASWYLIAWKSRYDL